MVTLRGREGDGEGEREGEAAALAGGEDDEEADGDGRDCVEGMGRREEGEGQTNAAPRNLRRAAWVSLSVLLVYSADM
jgi:hypothetical protein